MKIDTKEVLRYLGYHGNKSDEQTIELINSVKLEIIMSVQPKSIYREFELKYISDSIISVGGVCFKSKKLRSHLKNSDRILLFAATLGLQSDALVGRYQNVDSARAAVMQAALAATVESFCDDICGDISCEEQEKGYYLRPRFSPGYGDMALESQRDFFKLLDCSKRIGLTLSDSCIMIPTKSVTAFIGLTKDKECNFNSCGGCENIDCAFRRET